MNNPVSTIISKVIEELTSHPDIVIDELILDAPADQEDITKEEKLPGILREFYQTFNGITLKWHSLSDSFVKGGISLPSLKNLHSNRWKSYGILDFTSEVHILYLRREAEDSRVMMESLESDEDVEFIGLSGNIVTIEDYFKAFRKTYGYRFWQENFSIETEYSIDTIIENRCFLWNPEPQNPGDEHVYSPHSTHPARNNAAYLT